jgi:hypothetical protein
LPHDYHRFTEPGIRLLLTDAGFADLDIVPRSSGFAAIAQLLLDLRWAMGDDAEDGLSDRRSQARELLERLATRLAALDPLDVKRLMPLGYCATAQKP